MQSLSTDLLESFWHDNDRREEQLRRVVAERLALNPPPKSDDYVIATYFFAFPSLRLDHAVDEISYHATTGIKHPPPGSLPDACSTTQASAHPFDDTRPLGLLHAAFPLK